MTEREIKYAKIGMRLGTAGGVVIMLVRVWGEHLIGTWWAGFIPAVLLLLVWWWLISLVGTAEG